MKISPFLIGRYFAQWELNTPYFLSTADVENYHLEELLALADEESRDLWRHLSLGYTATAGHPLLRAAIASLYTGIEPDEILVFAGGEEAIFVLLSVLLEPGDHAVVIWPAYQSLYEVGRAAGAEVTLVPLVADDGWSLDISAVQKALRPTTRVIVVNFPHAPTGALPDHATFAALCDLAHEAGASLFSDESFRFLEFDSLDRLPAAVESGPSGISLGAMSKAFGLAGLRIGWLATHDRELIRRVLAFKDYTSVSNSAPSEILALMALRSRETILARSLGIIQHNLTHLDRFFARWSEVFSWVRPRAGSVGFPRLHLNVPIDHFISALVEQEAVLLVPGSVYDYPGSHFRIGFGRVDVPMVLERFERFTRTYLQTMPGT
jgi:aspartate/methionine/tyrosine aminotransferase